MKNKVFVTITHTYHPIPRSDQFRVQESVEFLDNLKNRHYLETTVILDMMKEKVLKNRPGTGTFESYTEYLLEKYPDKMNRLYEIIADLRGEIIEASEEEVKDVVTTES